MAEDNQQRQVYRPAAPFEVVGFNGMGGLPTIRQPAVPEVGIEDQTARFQQQTSQSIDNAYQYASSTIDAVAKAATEQAGARQRSGFGNTFAGIVEGIGAGVELWGKLEEQKESKLAKEMEVQQSQLAAEFENQVREQVLELHRAVASNTSDEGLIPTFTSVVRQLRSQFAGHLNPETLQEITNIAWGALTEVQGQQGVRWQSELEDTQATLREQRLSQATIGIMDIVNSMSHGTLQHNPSEGMRLINQSIGTFLSENDITGMEAIYVTNGLMPKIIAAMEAGGQNAAQMRQQQGALGSILEEAQRVNEEYGDNAEARNAMLAPLQLQLDQLGIGVTLSDVFRTQMQRFGEQAEYIKTVHDLQTLQQESAANGIPTSGVEGQAMSAYIALQAMDWVNNSVMHAAAIDQASRDGAPAEMRAAYRIYQDFQEDRGQVMEQQAIIARRHAEVAQARSRIEQYADQVDPDGRLGPPQFTDQYARALVQLAGQRNPEISRALSESLGQWQNANIFAASVEISNAERLIQQTAAPWQSMGINILDPTDTTGLRNQVAALTPLLEQVRTQTQAAGGAQQPLQPSNFSLGLPPLPQR